MSGARATHPVHGGQSRLRAISPPASGKALRFKGLRARRDSTTAPLGGCRLRPYGEPCSRMVPAARHRDRGRRRVGLQPTNQAGDYPVCDRRPPGRRQSLLLQVPPGAPGGRAFPSPPGRRWPAGPDEGACTGPHPGLSGGRGGSVRCRCAAACRPFATEVAPTGARACMPVGAVLDRERRPPGSQAEPVPTGTAGAPGGRAFPSPPGRRWPAGPDEGACTRAAPRPSPEGEGVGSVSVRGRPGSRPRSLLQERVRACLWKRS